MARSIEKAIESFILATTQFVNMFTRTISQFPPSWLSEIRSKIEHFWFDRLFYPKRRCWSAVTIYINRHSRMPLVFVYDVYSFEPIFVRDAQVFVVDVWIPHQRTQSIPSECYDDGRPRSEVLALAFGAYDCYAYWNFQHNGNCIFIYRKHFPGVCVCVVRKMNHDNKMGVRDEHIMAKPNVRLMFMTYLPNVCTIYLMSSIGSTVKFCQSVLSLKKKEMCLFLFIRFTIIYSNITTICV